MGSLGDDPVGLLLEVFRRIISKLPPRIRPEVYPGNSSVFFFYFNRRILRVFFSKLSLGILTEVLSRTAQDF